MTTSTIQIVHSLAELRAITNKIRNQGQTVGFVPTMGALHSGHLKLVEVARKQSHFVVVSIFVNPTQFGPNEDFERYPRTLETDAQACQSEGADLIFSPDVETMYPPGSCTVVSVPELKKNLCGSFRPVHFDGVATVVTKLFNQVGPCTAVFGRKDFQQLTLIKRMVKDLAFDVEVIGVQTVREDDGLALSSRNVYLKSDERRRARALVKGLSAAWNLVEKGDDVTAEQVRTIARVPLDQELDSVDYVEVCDPETLELLPNDQVIRSKTLIAMAGKLGVTRLIDNVVLKEDPDPLGS